jgi:hypothetical protein
VRKIERRTTERRRIKTRRGEGGGGDEFLSLFNEASSDVKIT